jgi:hypothetical protein
VITGVSLRFSTLATNPASWPPAPITWTNYDIWVGPANPTSGWVGDVFANFAATPVQVRTGPLTLEAGMFANLNPPAPTPNPWAEFYFDFKTPYTWLGGDLAFLFSHPGSLDPALAMYPETVASSAATYGVGRSQSIYPPGTASAATTFYVMRIHYGYAQGCPGASGTPPVLVQNGNTSGGLGGLIQFQVGNAPPTTQVIFVAGSVPIYLPLGNGCDLHVNPELFFQATANSLGRAVITFQIPPGVTGTAFVQAGVLDFLLPGGFAATNAVSPAAL